MPNELRHRSQSVNSRALCIHALIGYTIATMTAAHPIDPDRSYWRKNQEALRAR
jgi:hypothetical protein